MTQQAAVVAVSEFFHLHPRTVYKWIADGVNVFSPASIVACVEGIQRPSSGVAGRIAEGPLQGRLEELLDFDPLTPPPFSSRVLGELRDALLGVTVARRLLEHEQELVAH